MVWQLSSRAAFRDYNFDLTEPDQFKALFLPPQTRSDHSLQSMSIRHAAKACAERWQLPEGQGNNQQS
jgi:hypothetical protein